MRTAKWLAPVALSVMLTGCGSITLPSILNPAPAPAPAADNAGLDVPAPVFQQALESQPSGAGVTWRDRFSGEGGTVTPVRTFRADTGEFCRAFEVEIQSERGWTTRWSGVACRERQGDWVPA